MTSQSKSDEIKQDDNVNSKLNKLDDIDTLSINTIRVLSADMVQKANSGHPGMPMGMAPVAHILFTRYLNINPSNPNYLNRDRFVLSNGHGCALHYSLLHLSGFKQMKLDNLKQFRQLNSITPGHPENHMTDGIEVSTGPLGQGIAQGIGLGLAQKHMASIFNKDSFKIFDHKIWIFCGDGCLQEGVASEAASLAGHWKLDNVIIIYDDNHIQIDGTTDLAFTEDVPMRFKAYGWETYEIQNGNTDFKEIDDMLSKIVNKKQSKPILISLKTIIGFGSSKENTHGVHGAPLGTDVLKAYKKKLNFDPEKSFDISGKVYERYKTSILKRGETLEKNINNLLKKYNTKYPKLYAQLKRMLTGKLPDKWQDNLPKFNKNSPKLATRNINGNILNILAPKIPEIIGGAADLTPSTKTQLKCSFNYQYNKTNGRYIRFGVREFGMFAISNGISAYGTGLIPFSATFLNFLTYGWGAVRLGAISHLQHIYVMTHDSVFLGEDGPTHQPIEVIPLVRCTPNIMLFRPADGNENNAAWIQALNNKKMPTVMCLSRQKINAVDGTSVEKALKGAYIVSNEDDSKNNDADVVILIATGTEVATCVDTKELLKKDTNIRIVSAPCLELFDKQTSEYKSKILTNGILTISVEACATQGWNKYSHKQIGINTFGESAPLKDIQEHFKFTPQLISQYIKDVISKCKGKKLPPLPCNYDF